MVQRSLAAATAALDAPAPAVRLPAARLPAARLPPARLLAERVAAIRLPPPGRHRRPGPHPGWGRAVVCVVTGAGIERVLPHLRAGEAPSRLVWAAGSPRASYGDEVLDLVLAAGPGATVWDTDRFGPPDLLRLAFAAWASSAAEGVVCVSDRRRTRDLVRGLASRGVPAYGEPGRTSARRRQGADLG